MGVKIDENMLKYQTLELSNVSSVLQRDLHHDLCDLNDSDS